MTEHVSFPLPSLQSLGLVSIPTSDRPDAGWIERKPVVAAVLTMSQRDDGHVMIFHETVTAAEETQFPLAWLVERELIAGAPMLVGIGDPALLLADAAERRFFVEPKLAALATSDRAVDVAALAGERIDEAAVCRRLGIPRLDIDATEAERVWASYPPASREAHLGQHALAGAVTRLMLWANLTATREAEPGWHYETMLALRSWLDEREADAPDLYRWGTSRPVMRAVSFAGDYRRDLARRRAGQPSDWPPFMPGLFHC